jgi:endoglucanase
MRRLAALCGLWVTLSCAHAACVPAGDWVAWSAFRAAYLQSDGRVIDRSRPDQATVSEGAAYSAFLALVADDRRTFDAVERWVRDNLAAGDLTQRLPAWRWGHGEDGRWDVLDAHSASDADLWLAYDLLEAGRLWRDERLSRLGEHLARRILDEEVATVAGLGPVLLPGPAGFVSEDGHVRVNPSYAPPFVLARLAAVDERYRALAKTSGAILDASVAHGFVPDWVDVGPDGAIHSASGDAGRGSYDAIRVYLWVALSASSAEKTRWTARLKPVATTIFAAHWPEWVDPRTGAYGGRGGRAHAAAWLPLMKLVAPARYAQLRASLTRPPQIDRDGRRYYGDVLGLMALGAVDGRFGFTVDGRLQRRWVPCRS